MEKKMLMLFSLVSVLLFSNSVLATDWTTGTVTYPENNTYTDYITPLSLIVACASNSSATHYTINATLNGVNLGKVGFTANGTSYTNSTSLAYLDNGVYWLNISCYNGTNIGNGQVYFTMNIPVLNYESQGLTILIQLFLLAMVLMLFVWVYSKYIAKETELTKENIKELIMIFFAIIFLISLLVGLGIT